MKKKLLFFSMAAMCLMMCACGSSNPLSDVAYSTNNYKSAAAQESGPGFADYAYEEEYREEPAAAEGNVQQEEFNDSARKLIKNYNLTVETETYDECIKNIETEIDALHGYVENLNSYNGSSNYRSNRSSNYTVRIPQAKLDEFVNYVGTAAYVTNKTLNVQDVTLQYVDVESRKKSYEIERDTLNDLLAQAYSIDDIISIENRLSEIRYMLESMESQLRTYDNLVDYATVYLNICEVVQYTPAATETFGEKISRSFREGIADFVEGLKNFAIWFVGALPRLIFIAAIVCAIVFIIRGIKKSSSKKKARKEFERAAKLSSEAQKTAEANKENLQ